MSDWLLLVAACALGAMTPGPSLAVIVRHSLAGGRQAGLAAALAHGAGVGGYAALTVAGLAGVLAAHPALLAGIQALGAAYLAWLALRAARGAWRAGASAAEASEPSARPGLPATSGPAPAARDGLAMALLNPKIALFFLAVFSGFTGPATAAWEQGALIAIAAGVDAGWYALVAVLVARPAWRGRLEARRRLREALLAVVLALLAAYTGGMAATTALAP